MANQIAYGFVGLEHLFSERLENVNVQVVMTAVEESIAEHNRQAEALMAELAMATTDYKTRFKQRDSYTLQPLDEYGRPRPTRPVGYYDVAFPIQGGGAAYGFNHISAKLATVEDINRLTLETMGADADWMKRHMLATIFDNVAWTYDDDEHGSLTIQPLANGDSVTYVKKSGAVAADTHYLAQAVAIDASNNPFPTIYDELKEHPVNANATIVSYVPTALKTSIKALSTFFEVEDMDVQPGNASDTLTGSIDRGFGDEVLGKADGVWIVEWSILPSEHMVSVARGTREPIMKMRQYPATSLQGFFEKQIVEGNLETTEFYRFAGFGGFNRVGALVYQVGNATYEIPTDYDAPLAV
jgi:hypothetical protein